MATQATRIPLFDPEASLRPLRERLEERMREILESGRFVLGPQLKAFEQEFAQALTPKTKAILTVDLFGNPAQTPEIETLGVPVLEDAAQAAGSVLGGRRAGSLGHAATFSFYPSKNLGAFGDAGAIATDDDELAETIRSLRSHGSRDKVTFEKLGFNTRLDELQAGLLRVLLPELDGWCEGRRRAARMYEEAGAGDLVRLPRAVDGADPAWHLYIVRHERADELVESLNGAGIESRAYYRTPVHRQEPMRAFARDLDLPATEEASRTNFALPINATLEQSQVAHVVETLRAALEG